VSLFSRLFFGGLGLGLGISMAGLGLGLGLEGAGLGLGLGLETTGFLHSKHFVAHICEVTHDVLVLEPPPRLDYKTASNLSWSQWESVPGLPHASPPL